MTGSLRVLLLVPSMVGAGGTERVVFNLANLLSGLGHAVAVATFDAPGAPFHFPCPQPHLALGPLPRLPLALRPFEYLLSARRLAAAKRRFRPQVTISNLWRADLISQLAGGDDAKVAIGHINVVGNPTNAMMVRLRALVSRVYRRFDRVVAVSAPLADELRELYRLAPQQAVAIDNFSDAPTATARLPDDGRARLLWCGRLVPEKNLAGMLDLWAAFCRGQAGAQLVVLGDGPLDAALKAQADALGLIRGTDPADPAAQVVFAGRVSSPADYMVGARALVLTSLAEGMPMVLLEALALGTPILAADCPAGGVRAVLDSGGGVATGCGALLPIPVPGDAQAQAAWLPWLERAADDADEVVRWRQAALVRAERYSSRAAGLAWQALLDKVAR